MSNLKYTLRLTEEEIQCLGEIANTYIFSFKQRPVKTEEAKRVAEFASELLKGFGIPQKKKRTIIPEAKQTQAKGETSSNVLKDATGVEEERVTPGLKVDSGVVKEQAPSGDGNSGTTT